MNRYCTHCQKSFTPKELCKQESRLMESERKELGLQGVHFWYYRCTGCGTADIFVDVFPLEGEPCGAFRNRRDELEASLRGLHSEETEFVLVERHPGFSVWA